MKFLSLLSFWFSVFSPRVLSHHGQFHLSFTKCSFFSLTQFFYLSQSIHSLGVHWNSLNIISNIWQSLWNVNEMKNQIYLESRSNTVVSEGCCCLGRARMMGSCNYSHKLSRRAEGGGDGMTRALERGSMG